MSLAKIKRRFNRVDLVERAKSKDSVSNYLMAMSYDKEAQVYTLADLSVGALFEVTPIAASVLSDEDLERHSEAIAHAFSKLPDHTIIQTIIAPTTSVDADVKTFLSKGGSDQPILATMERMVAEHFRESVRKPLFKLSQGDGGFKSKRYRIFMSIVVRPNALVGGAKMSMIDWLRGLFEPREEEEIQRAKYQTPGAQRFLGLREELYKGLLDSTRRIEGIFSNNHLSVRRVPPEELIGLTRMMMWPKRNSGMAPIFDPGQQLALQIPLGEVTIECPTGSIMTDDCVHKVVTMSTIPHGTSPGTMTLPQQGLSWLTLLDFIGDGFLCVSSHVKPTDDMRRYLERRKRHIHGGFAMPSKQEQLLKDIDQMSFYMETDRRKGFDIQLSICVRAQGEREAYERAEKIRDTASSIGFDCRIEQHFAPSIFFQSMPFGFAPTIQEARRTHIVPDRVAADFQPFFMPSRGTKGGMMLLHNRLGEPFIFDPFSGTTAAHCAIVGESGSGKSFWTNYLIYCALRTPTTQVFAIDKGRSYATSTSMLGSAGSYNNMGLSAKTCINAFAGTLETSNAFLRQFIAHLASQVENDRLTTDQMGIVDECILAAFREKQTTATWRRYEEIAERWPRGAWIDRMRKRLYIRTLETQARQQLEQKKARDIGRAPEFEIYTQAILRQRKIYDPESKELKKTEDYRDVQSISQSTRDWLTSRGYKVENCTMSDGSTRACVLFLTEVQGRMLEPNGFSIQIVRDIQVLEVARREDVLELSDDQTLSVIYPEEYLTARREAFEAAVHAEHPGAAQDVAAEIVGQRIADLKPVDYFDSIDGEVIIQNEVFFSDFIRALSQYRLADQARMVTTRLAAYYGNGALAGFFDGETQFRLDSMKLGTFELQELSNGGDHLVAAVVGTLLQMLVLYCQSEHLPDGGPRAYKKFIILDEFWALLAVPMVADLVINGLRTLRKHNASIIVISQSIRDFGASDKGKAVLANVQHHILLRQPPEVIADLDKTLHWSAEQQALMYTVVSSKGIYSEAMISIPNQGICEVTRFVPTPYAYWIFTTSPDDVKQRDLIRNVFRAKGIPSEEALDRALQECALRWPNGVTAGEVRR